MLSILQQCFQFIYCAMYMIESSHEPCMKLFVINAKEMKLLDFIYRHVLLTLPINSIIDNADMDKLACMKKHCGRVTEFDLLL